MNEYPYAMPVPQALREAAQLRKQDPELLSLDNEIAMLRALQESLKMRVPEDGQIDPDDPAVMTLLSLAERIGKLVERSHKLQMERRMMVPAQRVVAFMENLAKVIKKHIKDDDVLEAIYAEISQAEKIT